MDGAFKKQQQGVTLLETLLVLAIGASIVLLSLNFYKQWAFITQTKQLQYNVDSLFQAASYFYQANCSAGNVLDPANNPKNPYNLPLTTLQNQAYLETNFPLNPLVANNGNALTGYIVQLNNYTSNRTSTDWPGYSPATFGNISLWTIEVAVNLQNTNLGTELQNILSADCVTSMMSTNQLVTCQQNSTFYAACQATIPFAQQMQKSFGQSLQYWLDIYAPGCSANNSNYNSYLAFERLPATKQAASVANQMNMPVLQLFNQMYTTYPNSVLIPNNGVVNGKTQNYLCGS